MLEVSKNTIEKFVNDFLSVTMYADLNNEQQENLKDFLINYLEDLYSRNADMISLIEQLDTINPFMIKLSLGYGILEEDVVDLVRILFMKVNEFFYKQGSFEIVKNIKYIYEYYGITSHTYKVIYDKTSNTYLLEDVLTGERKPSNTTEFITSGHSVHRDEYSALVFSDRYNTIVIYIEVQLYEQVDKKMSYPVALLHAYAITTHMHDTVSFYTSNKIFDISLKDFLDFLRYYYISYIKIKNPNFEFDEESLEMWNLFITDQNDLDSAKTLLTELLNNVYNSREGIAYYQRTCTMLLNKYKVITTPPTYEKIKDRVYSINSNLATAIDKIESAEDYIKNIIKMTIYFEEYLHGLPNKTTLDLFVKNTLRYLFMHVQLALTSKLSEHTHTVIRKYKRYYLPVYTQFIIAELKKYIVKNDFYRLYYEDNKKITCELIKKDTEKPSDNTNYLGINAQEDRFETLDSVKITITKEGDYAV